MREKCGDITELDLQLTAATIIRERAIYVMNCVLPQCSTMPMLGLRSFG